MIKLIVTHQNPDLDAITSVWIFRKFDKKATAAKVAFVPAGEVATAKDLQKHAVTTDEVVHVDTGMGQFDHHTSELASKPVCAASLVRDYLITFQPELELDESLARIVEYAVEIDHFGECFWPEANHDRYVFQLDEILGGIKASGGSDQDVVTFGCRALDAVYARFGDKVKAEEEVEKGIEIKTVWGKGLAVQTANESVLKVAQKTGFSVVIKKDPEKGHVRIKAQPQKKIDLTEVYEKIRDLDKTGTWYFHPSKTMVLNGSDKNKNQTATNLTLEQIVKIVESSSKTTK